MQLKGAVISGIVLGKTIERFGEREVLVYQIMAERQGSYSLIPLQFWPKQGQPVAMSEPRLEPYLGKPVVVDVVLEVNPLMRGKDDKKVAALALNVMDVIERGMPREGLAFLAGVSRNGNGDVNPPVDLSARSGKPAGAPK